MGDKDAFLMALKAAVTDRTSPEFRRLYEFLLTIFVEEDHDCRGVICRDGFERIIERAAFVPRAFGLAPPKTSVERIDELYEAMEDRRMKGITFRKFLEWSVQHLNKKLLEEECPQSEFVKLLKGDLWRQLSDD